MTHPVVSLAELKAAHFPSHDVLKTPEEIAQRAHDLRSAMAFTNIEHDEVGIVIQLADGSVVEYLSDFIDFEGPLVELKGGYAIPVKSILRVEI